MPNNCLLLAGQNPLPRRYRLTTQPLGLNLPPAAGRQVKLLGAAGSAEPSRQQLLQLRLL